MRWVLLWIYLAPSGQIETEIEHVAAKSVVMTSREWCEDARRAQLVCVQVPDRGDHP